MTNDRRVVLDMLSLCENDDTVFLNANLQKRHCSVPQWAQVLLIYRETMHPLMNLAFFYSSELGP